MMERYPALFIGHGSPMNALQNNDYTQAWKRIGEQLPKPRAILMISAHWNLNKTAVTAGPTPRTIHDFGGFPPQLYEIQYPAPGDTALGLRVQALLAPVEVELSDAWGLDHGAWSVLRHIFPNADVPTVELSIDATQPAAYHFEIGRMLAPLRAEGVLIMGSGNVVHNLQLYDWDRQGGAAYDWALRFEEQVRNLIAGNDFTRLVDYDGLGADARRSIPTPEHYLPLLYVLGSRHLEDAVSFPVAGIVGGSISMLSVQLGAR